MKVLFVCRQNVGRSQMAKAFYNRLSRSQDAGSAGTHVDMPGQTIEERMQSSSAKNFFLLDVMNDAGYDLSKYTRTPLAEDMLENYDVVVNMANAEDTPDWLLHSSKYVYWDVSDPRGQDYEVTARIRDEIKAKVEELVAKTRD